jgi:hypothetical protein
MPKRFFLIILVVLLINPYNLSGQYANKQIGLRSGIPISISLNAKPFVELSVPAFVNVVPGDIGISVAYVF